MRFSLFVALRYLLALRKQAFISLISAFSVVGVGLGVAALIVVLGVMNGFSNDLRDKILGVNAHVIVGSFEGGMADYRSLREQFVEMEEVVDATPFIYSEVMLSTSSGVKGVVLRGIDPKTSGRVLSLPEDLVSGSISELDTPQGELPGIILGAELARRLGIRAGARVNLLSPTGQKSAAGFTPRIKMFRVVGMFRTGMFEYDSSLAYVSMEAAQDLLGWEGDLATGLELRLDDVYQADEVASAIDQDMGGYPMYVRSWMEMNANLFAALELEKTAMFIILIMIVLVGSFSIITTLVMLVMEKTRDIAILLSMGATPEMVRRVFMLQGTIIGVVGTVLGFALGVPLALFLKRYQFIELPRDVYPVDYLPVKLAPLDLTFIGVAALALCFLATLYPARKAARLNPADALRYE